MAAELKQDDLTLTRLVGKTVSFSCLDVNQCSSDRIYWLQKKEHTSFIIILYMNRKDCSITAGYGHRQEKDFSTVKTAQGCELEIKKVKPSHSAMYYCSCWKGSYTVREDPCSLDKNRQMFLCL